MKKFIKITAVVGAIIVVLGIVCIVAGISKGGSNIVKEEIGFSYNADIMEVYYINEGDSLNVLIQYKKKWKKGIQDVTVYLPSGKSYGNFNLSLSAGEADIENMSAVYTTINSSAGR